MLGEVVGCLEGTLSPYESELALSNLVSHPVEAHVEKNLQFLSHGCSWDEYFGGVVSETWCASWRMGMTQFNDG